MNGETTLGKVVLQKEMKSNTLGEVSKKKK